MTLIEFDNAAKAILFEAGLFCHLVQTEVVLNTDKHGNREYQYKLTAHPSTGMLTSWSDGLPYQCNNPTLALERFQTAVNRRLAPPSEPEAITEIEFGAVNYETNPTVIRVGESEESNG